jgi:hypothetical protein
MYLNNLFWRNTKESVKNEYELPPVIEDLVLLDYTHIEKALYSDFKNNADISMKLLFIRYINTFF